MKESRGTSVLSGWETACQYRGHRFNPWSGTKNSQAGGQLSLCDTKATGAPRDQAPQQEKPQQWEAWAQQLKSIPFSLQLQKASA